MNIILEGCDGVGKTTLAKKLCGQFKQLKYIHAPYKLESESYDEFSNRVDHLYRIDLAGDNLVLDRSFYSEYAYNLIKTTEYTNNFERQYEDSIAFILIYCDNNKLSSYSFWKTAELHNIDLSQGKLERVKRINSKYLQAFSDSLLENKLKIEFRDNNYDEIYLRTEIFVEELLK